MLLSAIIRKFRTMTAQEIKSEIQKVLDNVPEDTLGEILDYLKQLEGKSGDVIALGKNIRTILTEDKELLEKLAK